MPRATDAYTTSDKWRGWILAVGGHGPDWARVFGVGPHDSNALWDSIAAAILEAPISAVRNRGEHGVVCGVELALTINDRTALVATAWHYADKDAAPRLVTAYPSP